MGRRRSIAATSLALLPLQVVARAVEALLPLLLALWFGRSEATDVYTLAWAVFALAGSLVFSAFQDSAVVPVVAEVQRADPAAAAVARGSLLGHALALGGALAAIVAAAAAAWLSGRYTGDTRAVALAMVPPLALYLVALSVKTLLVALLTAEHRYAAVPIAGAVGALVLVGVVAGARGAIGIVAVPCGSLAGEVAAAGVLFAAVRAAGLGVRPTLARPEPVRRIARLVASEVAGSAVTRVNPVVDQLMASFAGIVGGGTLLRLSGDVATVPTSLLHATLLPVLLAHLSDDHAARDMTAVRAKVRGALGATGAMMAVAAALMWAVRGPLLHLVFEHGAMDAAGVDAMAAILPWHLLGLAPFGALLVLARAHVAVQNSRIMLSMGVLNAALNAGLNVALLPVLGLRGIALSTSCTYAIVAAVFWVRLRGRLAREGAAP